MQRLALNFVLPSNGEHDEANWDWEVDRRKTIELFGVRDTKTERDVVFEVGGEC